jgi:Ca2+-binding EF-hand superfamily protein
MSNNKDSELKEIIEGFNLFGSETEGLINPIEVKEIMDIMNMSEKNPFLYNIINNLCSDEEIQRKGGINAEDFISLLDQELDDISSLEGLQKIFSIFSDVNSNKISLPTFSQIINQNDMDLGKDSEDIKKLISKPEISGKEIDFNEFKDLMKTGKEIEKPNLIYMKKSSHNSSAKKSKINENNNDINNKSYNNQDSKQNSETNINIIDTNNKWNSISKNEIENFNEIEQDEDNNKNIIELNYDNDVNNFDNVNPEYKLNNPIEENNKSKKKYRHMHESPKNKKENEFQNDKEEINNQGEEKIINNISYENKSNEKFNEEININVEENANNKEDKAEKRYHRRYRDIKSPPQKQKEENPRNENNVQENTDNKISSKYWRYRRKK